MNQSERKAASSAGVSVWVLSLQIFIKAKERLLAVYCLYACSETTIAFNHMHRQTETRIFWSLVILSRRYADSGDNMALLLVVHLVIFFWQLPMNSL